MSLEDISKKFLSFGLDEDESKVLTNLYLLGNSKVNLISRSAGISRVQAYRALKKLQDRNLVETSLNRPVRFSAIPVDKALGILIAVESNKLKFMKETTQQIMKEISRFKIDENVIREAKYKVIEGRAQVYSVLSSIIKSAKSEIIFFMAKEDLMRTFYAGVFDVLDEAHERGVKIRVLTEVDHTSMDMVENFCKFADLRHIKIPGISIFVVIDDSDLLLSAMTREMENLSEGNVALWTNARNFITGIKRLLSESWNNSQDALGRIHAIKDGKTIFEEVLVLRDSRTIEDFFTNMVSNAKSEVCFVSVPYDKQFFDKALQKATMRSKQEAVKLRILTSIESGVLAEMKHLGNFADVRHIELQTSINALIVDGKETLILPPAINQRFIHAIWSNVKEFVGFFTGMFDMLWSNSAELAVRMSLLEKELNLTELKISLETKLKKLGFSTKYALKGSSGISHKFYLVGVHANSNNTVVIDVDQSGSKDEAEVPAFNFAAKCFDVKAKHRLLITAFDREEIKQLSAVYGNQFTIVNINEVDQFLHNLVEIINP